MILADESATRAIGAQLSMCAQAGDVITLSGNLGAGKTMLARGFLAGLGHQGEVPSPTFAIVQAYEDLQPPVWHVDLYRIEDAAEIAELGLDVSGDGVLIVEWPERAGAGMWPEALSLRLESGGEGARCLTVNVPPAWETRWPPQ